MRRELDPERFTLGVEEEYQLVDPWSGALRSRARAVLEGDWSGEIRPEMQQNTIEVGTRVCRSSGEVRDELARLRMQAAVAAEAHGLRVVAAGTHPFTHYGGQTFTPGAVYQHLRAEYRQLADSQNIFGMHVHVALPEEVDRAQVMNVVRHYAPLLLALSGSSPYYLAEDTGYESYRSLLWRRWPRTGAPPRFRDAAEYARLVTTLLETGRIDEPGRIYWDVRPHHVYPTLEFRAADSTPRLDDAVAIATLARALVVGVAAGVLREPSVPESMLHPFLSENGWRAARDGIDAELVDCTTGEPRVIPARALVAELAEVLVPAVAGADDAAAWAALEELLERGAAARRLRELAAAGGELPRLVEWLADETVLGIGLDRRTEQRDVV